MTTTSTAPVRRWIVRVTIGSFSLAALMGIAALLGAGSFGEFEGQILLTTLLVGVVSIAVLCYLATAGRRSQFVGVAGGVVVLVPLVTALLMIWGADLLDGPGEGLLRTFGVGAIVAATLAQASLLLALCDLARTSVRRLLTATLSLAALLALLACLLVVGLEPDEDLYLRVLGVVAILDVLGTVVVAALVKFGPSTDGPAPGGVAGRTPGTSAGSPGAAAALPADLRPGVTAYAATHGLDADEVVARAVRSFLTRESSTTTEQSGSGTGVVAR